MSNKHYVQVRWLRSTEEIEEAEKLLFICYVSKAKHPWLTSPTNASQIRLERSEHGGIKMTDRYKFKAKWAGAFVDIDGIQILTGVVRLYSICNENVESMDKLEMEHYPTFPRTTSSKILNISKSYSYRTGVTRLAVLPQYRRLNIFKMLLTFITRYMLYIKSAALTTTHVKFLRKQYKSLGAIEIGQFRYEPHDPSDAFIYFFDKNALKNISSLAKKQIVSVEFDNKHNEIISIMFNSTRVTSKL